MPQAVPFDLPQWIISDGLPVVSEGPWQQSGYRWVLNPCPWNSAHTNKSAFVVQFASGAIAAGCHHNGCHGNNWYALRDLCEPGGRPTRALQRSTSVATATLRSQARVLGPRSRQDRRSREVTHHPTGNKQFSMP